MAANPEDSVEKRTRATQLPPMTKEFLEQIRELDDTAASELLECRAGMESLRKTGGDTYNEKRSQYASMLANLKARLEATSMKREKDLLLMQRRGVTIPVTQVGCPMSWGLQVVRFDPATDAELRGAARIAYDLYVVEAANPCTHHRFIKVGIHAPQGAGPRQMTLLCTCCTPGRRVRPDSVKRLLDVRGVIPTLSKDWYGSRLQYINLESGLGLMLKPYHGVRHPGAVSSCQETFDVSFVEVLEQLMKLMTSFYCFPNGSSWSFLVPYSINRGNTTSAVLGQLLDVGPTRYLNESKCGKGLHEVFKLDGAGGGQSAPTPSTHRVIARTPPSKRRQKLGNARRPALPHTDDDDDDSDLAPLTDLLS